MTHDDKKGRNSDTHGWNAATNVQFYVTMVDGLRSLWEDLKERASVYSANDHVKLDVCCRVPADTKAIQQLEVQERLLARIKEKTAVVKTETKGTTTKETKPSEDISDKIKSFDTIVKYQMSTLTELKTENGRLSTHIEGLMEDFAVASLKLHFHEKWNETVRARNGVLMFWMVMSVFKKGDLATTTKEVRILVTIRKLQELSYTDLTSMSDVMAKAQELLNELGNEEFKDNIIINVLIQSVVPRSILLT